MVDGMKILDFLSMLSSDSKTEILCAVTDTEEYFLSSDKMKNKKHGTLFYGLLNQMPEEMKKSNFVKWDMIGNVFIFIIDK